ncbi:MAG: TonB-dependent receptor, partial [Deltaproteobacteria bacterium]|nr:TonB-dependent receptor [Deltaproteobacteria bacterium]
IRVTSERPYEHPASSAWETLSTYATWDARVNVKVSSFATLHVQARNLLDTAYASKAGYPEPGRTFWIGLRLRNDRPIATPSPRRAPSRP